MAAPLHVALLGPKRVNVTVPVGFWPRPRVATSKMLTPAGKPEDDACVAICGLAARAGPEATMEATRTRTDASATIGTLRRRTAKCPSSCAPSPPPGDALG